MAVPSNSAILYFSPTGSGCKIAKRIRKSFPLAITYDITMAGERLKNKDMKEIEVLFVIVPAYAQDLPHVVRDFLRKLDYYSKDVVPIVVYGNVSPGRSLFHMQRIFHDKGCRLLAAGAFVSCHSYNSLEQEISLGIQRPDEDDFLLVDELCRSVMKRMEGKTSEIELPRHKNPLSYFFPGKMALFNAAKPKIIPGKCIACRACQKDCPTGAIRDDLSIDNKSCIRCYRCAVSCARLARRKHIRFITKCYLKSHARHRHASKIY